MKIKITLSLVFLQICSILNMAQLNCQSYVTYEVPGGRLGDKLVAYVHAKWISYKYKLPLLYKPFDYSDKLMFSQLEEPFDKPDRIIEDFVRPWNGYKPDYTNPNNILFEIPYFPQCKLELGQTNYYYNFESDYKDPEFKTLLQKVLSPTIALETIKPPKDCISIAVQIRKNSGGFDAPLSYEVIEKLGYLPDGLYADHDLPLKHPSDDYYIEQIKRASEFFKNQKIYIFIFTDDPAPAAIVEKYEKHLKDYKNISFDYRKNENNHKLNVLEDMFSITNFDAFIRSSSNLGFIASIIGNFRLVISPRDYKKVGYKIIIDQVDIQT